MKVFLVEDVGVGQDKPSELRIIYRASKPTFLPVDCAYTRLDYG